MPDATVWRAELRGEACDVEALMRFLVGPRRVEATEDCWWLVVEAAGCTEYEAARSEIDRTLGRLNALARTNTSDFRQVARGPIQRVDVSGRATSYAEAAFADFEPRAYPATARRLGQDTPAPRAPDGRCFSLASTDEDVDEVLQLMGLPPPADWERLWNVFERIRRSARESTINAWMGSNETKRFRQTANHGRKGGGRHHLPHERPMGQRDGEEFIRKLVGLWLGWKLEQDSTEPKPE